MICNHFIFETTLRGFPMIRCGNYRFSKDFCRGVRTRWRCLKRAGCPGSITTIDGEIIKVKNIHNH
ncbi:unnamed protein product [Leptidea sinapis]|uniref:FLYWCH-type domain-containing protein n=1 Tax=Leptidea sinapis TaxID=189913 RepID=A0A5E4PZ34_9NEOP|nr:unnamed protein product [Leptidea sinapis]